MIKTIEKTLYYLTFLGLSLVIGFIISQKFLVPNIITGFNNFFVVKKNNNISITNNIIFSWQKIKETIKTQNIKDISSIEVFWQNFLIVKDKKPWLTFLSYLKKNGILYLYWHNWHNKSLVWNFLYNNLYTGANVILSDFKGNSYDYVVKDILIKKENEKLNYPLNKNNIVLFTCNLNNFSERMVYILSLKK